MQTVTGVGQCPNPKPGPVRSRLKNMTTTARHGKSGWKRWLPSGALSKLSFRGFRVLGFKGFRGGGAFLTSFQLGFFTSLLLVELRRLTLKPKQCTLYIHMSRSRYSFLRSCVSSGHGN